MDLLVNIQNVRMITIDFLKDVQMEEIGRPTTCLVW
jgi:hypothetical protein